MSVEMTEQELWEEEVWDRIQMGEYVVAEGSVYDYESGEYICNLKILQQ